MSGDQNTGIQYFIQFLVTHQQNLSQIFKILGTNEEKLLSFSATLETFPHGFEELERISATPQGHASLMESMNQPIEKEALAFALNNASQIRSIKQYLLTHGVQTYASIDFISKYGREIIEIANFAAKHPKEV